MHVATFRATLALLCLFALVQAPAQASVVARERVSLGSLSDASDGIFVAEVSATSPRLVLTVASALRGPALTRIELDPGRYVRFRTGQRAVFFLRRAPGGAWRPLVTEYQRILIANPALELELVTAIRGRIPSLYGNAAALAQGLFDQLESAQGRIREDAAWDLLRLKTHQPTAAQRAKLLSALKRAATTPLLRVCARWPEPAMLQPALDVARQNPGDLRQEAGRALEAIDAGGAMTALERDLRLGTRIAGLHATGVARALRDGAAGQLLATALGHRLEEVRYAAVKGLSQRELNSLQLASLELAVWTPNSRRVSSAGVAALALTAPGSVL
ncbi:MAG: hypothetical protein JKY65_21055 [Planctomycetes bacterium]|nr:hypothetical protein [Planctomycetota bacterium]